MQTNQVTKPAARRPGQVAPGVFRPAPKPTTRSIATMPDFSRIGIHTRPAGTAPLQESPLRQEDAGVDSGMPTGGGSAATTFPTYAQITGDATVTTAMDAAWTATKAATTRTSRREQGFWIKYDTASSSYTCSPTFTGPSVGPGETGAADPGSKPADSGTIFTVGLFHTHTPTTYRTGTRGVGPSSADNRFHNSNSVVGVIYDYVESPAGSGTIPGGHPLDSAATRYHSGPNQRT